MAPWSILPRAALPAGLTLTCVGRNQGSHKRTPWDKGLVRLSAVPAPPAHIDHTCTSHVSLCPALGDRLVVYGGDGPSILGLMGPSETGGPAPCTSHWLLKALGGASSGQHCSVYTQSPNLMVQQKQDRTTPLVVTLARGGRLLLREPMHTQGYVEEPRPAFFTDGHCGHPEPWLGPGTC